MSENLALLVAKSRDKDINCLSLLIKKFDPLISKLAYQLHYECVKTDLTIYFIEFMYRFNIKSHNEGAIVNYINSCLHREYCRLYKQYKKSLESEVFQDKIYDISYIDDEYLKTEMELFLYELKDKNVITDKQCEILLLKYFDDYSEKEIANNYKVSRQYINKQTKKALKKIQSYLQIEEVKKDGR